ncbi:MAG: hypothetical protein P4L46_15135 [Fimbriimonas sp.]|nr:hypothetical protein [Fimbriimonas sp.]
MSLIAVASLLFGRAAATDAQSMQNNDLREMSVSVRQIEQGINRYVVGTEIRSVLTPGEFSRFDLALSQGQVVFAEARSDAFDPVLDIVDSAGRVVATNDDRYPGDQRPLLFWRCDRSGSYSIHVHCFHDKLGGQFFFRDSVYNTIDVLSDQKVDQEVDTESPFLVRVSMKAGQIKEMGHEEGGDHRYDGIDYFEWISPIGLPDLSYMTIFQPAVFALLAPVSGDYYAMMMPHHSDSHRARVRIWMREIVPEAPTKQGNRLTAMDPAGKSAIWRVHVKKNDLIETRTIGLDRNCVFSTYEVPDLSKFDLTKPEANPFFPQPNRPADDKGPAFMPVGIRSDDNRLSVFHVWRDADLYLASNGASKVAKSFQLQVGPAATNLAEARRDTGRLEIGSTEFWTFDAKVGDVMTLDIESPNFKQLVLVSDPDMQELRHYEAGIDQPSDVWRMVTQKPGRYLVRLACLGNGGSGAYSISRKVLHARSLALGQPATGQIGDQQVQVWTFRASPEAPILVHWKSSNWNYEANIYDDHGHPTDFQRDDIDPHNRFGILTVKEPQTFVIVLTGSRDQANYSIDLEPIPSEHPITKAGGSAK